MAVVESIYVCPTHGETPTAVKSAEVTAASGLVGDRHAGAPAIVSLIAAEEVEKFNAACGLAISAAETGRNIVTRGVDLNALVGKRFHLGAVELEGMELCEPCATLGARLQTAEVRAADVVRLLTHKAGIRAYVRSDGALGPGTAVTT